MDKQGSKVHQHVELTGRAKSIRVLTNHTDAEADTDQIGRVIEQQKDDVTSLVDPSSKLIQ